MVVTRMSVFIFKGVIVWQEFQDMIQHQFRYYFQA